MGNYEWFWKPSFQPNHVTLTKIKWLGSPSPAVMQRKDKDTRIKIQEYKKQTSMIHLILIIS